MLVDNTDSVRFNIRMFDCPWQILDYQWLMKLFVESNAAKRQKLKAKKK